MAISDIVKKRKEQNTSATSSASSGRAISEIVKEKYTGREVIDSFLDDANTFANTDEGAAYSEWNRLGLGDRTETAKLWLKHNKSGLDDKTYSSISKAIDVITEYKDYYSRFKTEDEYNKHLAERKSYEDSMNFDLKKGQEEIDELEAQLSAANKKLGGLNNQITAYSRGNNNKKADGLREERKQIEDTIKSLKSTISAKRQYYTIADRIQRAEGFASIAKPDSENYDPNFEKLSNADETIDDTIYRYINNINGYRQEQDAYWSKNDVYFTDDGMAYPTIKPRYIGSNYDQMEDTEVALYNYFYNTEGSEKANEYLDLLADTLNYRAGTALAKETEDNDLEKYLFAVAAGLEQFETGVENLFTDKEYIPTSDTQYASSLIRESLADSGATLPKWLGGGSVGQTAYDAITTTSNMLPSILISHIPVVGQYAGPVLLGTSAAGNAKAEMLRLGYSKEQANTYGIMVGVSEAVMEKLLGGIPGLSKGDGIFSTLSSKAISKIDKTLARVAITIGGSAMDEALEEGLQTIIEPWLAEIATNVDWDDPQVDEILYSSLLGALSSIGLGVVGSVTNEVKRNQQITKHGQSIIDNGGADALKQLALEMYGNKGGYAAAKGVKLASDIATKPTAKKVGKLSALMENTITKQNSTDIHKALVEKGLSKKDAKIAAEYITDSGDLTEEQVARIESSDYFQKAIDAVLEDSNTNVSTDSLKLTEARIGNKAITEAESNAVAKENPSVTVNATEKEIATESEFKASADGKTKVGDTEVSIKEIASVKDGEVVLRLEDGSTVNASDVEFSSAEEGLLYENVVHMGLNAATANAFINGYEGNISVAEYALDFRQAYRYGELGIPKSEMASSGYSSSLSESQKSLAYDLGRTDAKYKAIEKNESKKAKITSTDTINTDKNANKGNKKGELHNTLTPTNETQKASLRTLGVIAEALGIDIYTFESEVVNGKRQGANGWYDPTDNSIHLDLFAGNDGRGTMLFTAAHELTHHIREKLPAKFKLFADFLFEQYGEKGISVAELIENKREFLEAKGRLEGLTEAQAYDLAYEEVVADACESFLADGEAVAKIAELKAKDKTLWQTIKDFLTKLVARIKEAYKGLSPDSVEGRLVAEMLDSAEDLKAMWTEMLVEASERILSEYKGGHRSFPVAKDVVEDFVKEHKDNEVRYSFRNSKSGMANDTLIPYNGEQTRFINQRGDYIIDSFEKLKEVVNLAFDQPDMKAIAHFGIVDAATLQKIKNSIPNLPESMDTLFTDNKDYSIATTLDGIRHIVKEKKLTRQDVIDYLDRFADTIVECDEVDFHFYTRRGRQMPGLLFRKDFPDGKYVSFDLVSQEKQSLLLQSLYIDSVDYEKRKSANPVLMQNAPASTPKARGGQTSTNRIAQKPNSVNRGTEKNSLRNIESIETADYVKMYNHFGSTKNYDVAGYILGNGMMLDFSGKHWGDDFSTTRQVDHRDIQEVLGNRGSNNGVNAMIDMIGNGNIRLMPEVGGINLAVKPNASQMSQLRGYINHFRGEVTIDIDEVGGDTIHSFNYTRGTSSSKILDDIKAYFDEGIVPEQKAEDETDIHQFLFSVREEAPPKKTEKAYKLMRLVDGKLYPLFIGNNEEISIGTWYNADSPNLSQLKNLAPGTHLVDMKTGEAMTWDEYAERHVPKKNGKPSRSKPSKDDVHWANDNGYRFMHIEEKAGGKSEGTMLKKYGDTRAYYNWGVNGSSKTESGEGSASLYALRPGWHFGEVPSMHQIGYDGEEGETVRLDNQVWVEVEMSADVDYNAEAEANWSGDIPTHIPTNGYYRFATNPTQKKTKGGNTANDATKADWYVAGAFKVNRIMSDSEADSIVEKYNKANGKNVPLDYRRNYGRVFNAETMSIEDSVRYSDRSSDSVSNRTLLANALESVAQNDIERKKLKEYKEKISLIESEQAKLAEIRGKIKELSFAPGRRDTEAIKKLQFEANQTVNRIHVYDRQLLGLESTTALKGVLEREKQMAYKRAEQKGKEALKRQKEKDAKTQRELLTRYQESRKKGVESRRKTEMRHKIKDVVNELNQYLLKGTKDKHVPIELQRAVAEALDAVNMDTVGAEERIAKKREEMMRAKTPDAIEKIAKEIEHIQEMGGNMSKKISRLKTAYDSIINSDDPLIANSHDEVISNTIERVMEFVGETPLRDMSLYQLEAVYDMYRMVLTSVRNANKAFKAAKSEEISVIANRVMEEIDHLGKKRLYGTKAEQAISKFDWNNLKPVYAFERIGSDTFTEVFNNVRAGEDTWAVDITEAKEFSEEQHKKYNYDSWDFNRRYGFTSTSGMRFELSLDQIMSLYAYSKREQAKDHLKKGGIVFDENTEVTVKTKLGVPVKFNPTQATAYNLSDETLVDIIDKLTPEQKAFVDAMQDYLSTTMGEKGNEVSLALYGVKLYKENNYFPLKSATQFMAKAKEQQKGEVKIKNSGFSKETTPKASNPIVLTPFMDVWAGHVNEMSMYHAFVLPLEDFYRVYNYKTPTSDTMATESVEMYLQNAYGKAATQYVDQLLKDINGGARVDSTVGVINKLTGLFKKSAVFASASVVIQQPSAIARATALVDTKYFVGMPTKGKHKEIWAEVKRYAPVAIIKEMGYFDTGMGQSTVEWIKGEKTLGDKIDDIASKAPSLADEYTWCAIWNAVKRETLHTHPKLRPNSEDFLKAVGERFTEVVTKTQVYDSVLSRSANMRSKDSGMKMVTAFMAEPTTSLNMLEDALVQGKRGNWRYARKAIGSVLTSMILNSILVSFVYAGRDDDEDKTYGEKYISTLTEELLDSFNPLTLVPFVKDIVSIVQGYGVERSDMAVITDVVNAWNNLDSDNRSVYRKVEDFAGAIASLFGLPLKNIMRDVRGMYNTIKSFITD